MVKKTLNIVYMGTSDFAVAPLDTLLNNGYKISAVITSPDKPAGRGLKINESPVKKYAIQHGLKVLQPTNLKSDEFIEELKNLKPDLQIIVAFRMLPEKVWKLPSIGTFNLHASLLPQYRGAAPINWAIINGETKTGVSTFFINENIDTGNLIMTHEENILTDDTAGELHDRLMNTGAELVLKTVRAIEMNNYIATPQNSILTEISDLKIAPKIFKNTCKINWNNTSDKVYNQIRGLSPYPTAWTELISPENIHYIIKIFKSKKEIYSHKLLTGQVDTDGKTHLSIAVTDGFIHLQEIQLSAKNKMTIDQFLRGFHINNDWNANSF